MTVDNPQAVGKGHELILVIYLRVVKRPRQIYIAKRNVLLEHFCLCFVKYCWSSSARAHDEHAFAASIRLRLVLAVGCWGTFLQDLGGNGLMLPQFSDVWLSVGLAESGYVF